VRRLDEHIHALLRVDSAEDSDLQGSPSIGSRDFWQGLEIDSIGHHADVLPWQAKGSNPLSDMRRDRDYLALMEQQAVEHRLGLADQRIGAEVRWCVTMDHVSAAG
jgi:hypothetical protein